MTDCPKVELHGWMPDSYHYSFTSLYDLRARIAAEGKPYVMPFFWLGIDAPAAVGAVEDWRGDWH